jgi:hypothetical protein
MSRTRKGSKGSGYELWGKRRGAGMDPGRDTKRVIHGLERADEKQLIQDEIREMEDEGDAEDST